ncbi:MAG: hypothetical protein ABSH20_09325 [Tepidisphaeraceae bacterium]|jgi:hypothetical protein
MARRPTHTIVFLGLHRTDRVDFGPAPGFPVLGQHHQSFNDTQDVAIQLEASLVVNSNVGKQVWILWEGASLQLLDMPTGAVEGLEAEQLASTLSYEAEPLTGVPASDSAIAGVPHDKVDAVAELRRYWIAQLPASLRNKLDEVVRRSGAKLIGIAHPGGLPRGRWGAGVTSDEPHEWRRIEVWDQINVSLHGKRDGSVETRLIRANPASEEFSADIPVDGEIAWMGPAPAVRVPPGGHGDPGTITIFTADGLPVHPRRVVFPADAVPIDWLAAWVEELTAKKVRIPLVLAPSNASPNQKFISVGGVAAAIILAACIGHGLLITLETAGARNRAEQLEKTRAESAPRDTSRQDEAAANAEADKLRPKLADLGTKDAQLTAELERVEKLASEVTTRQKRLGELRGLHRFALAELMSALADLERAENPTEIVIKDVRQQGVGGELRLSGLCRQSGTADGFATALNTRLAKAGWQVGAAQKRLRSDGIAYDFNLVLTPLVLYEQSRQEPLPRLRQSTMASGNGRGPSVAPRTPPPGGSVQ